MNMPLLNCEGPDSATKSLAEILGTTPAKFLKELGSVDLVGDEYADDVEHLLVERFLTGTELPEFSVMWFHGSRLPRDHTLMSDGLLPTHMIEARLRAHLKSLSEGLKPHGRNPFTISKSLKPKREGPFGVLCRDAAALPSGCNGRYLCRPELVDDIAGELLGENYRALTDLFEKESDPCVVHFIDRPMGQVLQRALRYVYETQVKNRDAIESANSATSCFDGGGEVIPPERILRIERLSASEF